MAKKTKPTLEEIVAILKKSPNFESVEIVNTSNYDNGEEIEIVSKLPVFDHVLMQFRIYQPEIYGLGYDNGVLNGYIHSNGYDQDFKNLDEFLDFSMANATYLDFNDGNIGDTNFKSVAKELQPLSYTQPIKDLGIVLDLSIWGGSTITFRVTFWLDGSNGGDTSGYGLQSVSKEGWDGKSADWFDSLVEDAIVELKRVNKKFEENYPFPELVVDIYGDKLAWVLETLVNNFLNYKKSAERYELFERKVSRLYYELDNGSGEGIAAKAHDIASKYVDSGMDIIDAIDRDETDRRDLERFYAELQELKNTQGEQKSQPLYDNDDILLYKNNVYKSDGDPENEDEKGWCYNLWNPNLDEPIWNVPENELKKVTISEMIEYLNGHAINSKENKEFEKLNLSKHDQEAETWNEVSKGGLEVMFLWHTGYNQLEDSLPYDKEDVWVLSTYVDYLNKFGTQKDIDKFYIAIGNVIGDTSELDNYENAMTVDEVVAVLRKSKTPLALVIAELKRVKAKQFIDVDKELEKHNTNNSFEVGDTVSYKGDTNSGKVFYGVIKSINGNVAKVSALDSNFEQDIFISELTLTTLPRSYADGGNLLNFGYTIGGL